jgi:RHS repeat-associated protein
MTGPMAKVNPFRSSTKYQDDETDLIYYGFRYLKTSTGAWLSRDPVADLGFGMQNGGTDAEQRDNAGQNIANLYCFVGNQPLSRWDNLGLEVAGGGVPSTSWLEHKNTLTFTISCPYGRYYYFDHVDYSGAVPGLENTFGKQRVDSLAGSIPPAAGLGGLDKLIGTNPRGVNCWAQPSTTVVHMRSRFTSPAPWFAGTKSAAGVTAYSAGTVVYYYCVRCTCQLPPMPPPDTGTGHVNDPTF